MIKRTSKIQKRQKRLTTTIVVLKIISAIGVGSNSQRNWQWRQQVNPPLKVRKSRPDPWTRRRLKEYTDRLEERGTVLNCFRQFEPNGRPFSHQNLRREAFPGRGITTQTRHKSVEFEARHTNDRCSSFVPSVSTSLVYKQAAFALGKGIFDLFADTFSGLAKTFAKMRVFCGKVRWTVLLGVLAVCTSSSWHGKLLF